jgi:hypothetical protein
VTVQVTDKDGDAGGASFHVAVANVAPTITAAANQSSNEGDSASFDLGSFSDPGAQDNPWSVDVDWGDASAHTTFTTSSQGSLGSKNHTYADNGSYPVAVTVTDKDGDSGSAGFTIDVANVAPDVSPAADQTALEGTTKSFALGSFSDPGANDAPWSVEVDWGDGSSHTTFGTASQGSLGSKNHTYADNGSYPVTVTVADKDGDSGQASFHVTTSNVPPSVTPPTDQSASEGVSASFTLGSFSDPGADSPWAVDVDWGDHGSHTTFTQTVTGSLGSKTHTFDDNGTYTVIVKVTDKDNASGQATFQVTVANVAPTATFNAPNNVDEGSPISLSLSSPHDPSNADTAAGFTYAFDCGDGSGFGPFSTTPSANCPTTDNGVRAVGGKVKDKDGGVSTYAASVAVDNVAPTATFNAPASVNEGSNIALSLTGASDPSSADTSAGFTYAFDCGDGSGYGPFSGSNGATCPTTDNGARPVGGKIRDKDGGVRQYTATVTVKNVAPSVTGPADQSSSEGSTASFTLGSFSDPGADSPWSVDINWGDGSAHSTFTKATTGSLGSQSHAYADNGSYTVTVIVTDKDAESGQATFKADVSNVSPTVTAPANQTADEGTPKSFDLGSFSDPGADSPWAVDVNWGDGSAHSTFTMSAAGTITAQSHVYTNGPATRTVTVKVTDKDGVSDTKTFSIAVANVKPVITSAAFSSSSVTCGSNNASLSGTFDDPGAESSWTVTITWGDGSPASTLTTTTHSFSASHTYDSSGTYSATITVTDDADTSAPFTANSTNITVNYVLSPILQPINPGPPNSIFKWGSTIPVKVRVQDCNGSYPSGLDLRVTFAMLSGSTLSGEMEPVGTNQADTGNQMRFSSGNDPLYIFNLASKSLGSDASATYRIYVTITATGQRVQADIGTKP